MHNYAGHARHPFASFSSVHLFLYYQIFFLCASWWLVIDFFFMFIFFNLGLILQGHLLPAIDFAYRHNDCFFDITLLSTVSDLYLPVTAFSFPFSFLVTICPFVAGCNCESIFHFLHNS